MPRAAAALSSPGQQGRALTADSTLTGSPAVDAAGSRCDLKANCFQKVAIRFDCAGQDHGELLSPHSAEHSAFGCFLFENLRDVFKGFVAGQVAVGIVHFFEVIDVDDHECAVFV